jgi:hypothetical protein
MTLDRIDQDRLFDIPDGLDLLPIRPEHCTVLIALPKLHRDPFDRMLIAQARAEQPVIPRRRQAAASARRAARRRKKAQARRLAARASRPRGARPTALQIIATPCATWGWRMRA